MVAPSLAALLKSMAEAELLRLVARSSYADCRQLLALFGVHYSDKRLPLFVLPPRVEGALWARLRAAVYAEPPLDPVRGETTRRESQVALMASRRGQTEKQAMNGTYGFSCFQPDDMRNRLLQSDTAGPEATTDATGHRGEGLLRLDEISRGRENR